MRCGKNLLNGADGITFKITEIASGNVIMGSGTNPPAPVIDPNVDGSRGPFQNLVINDVASNVFEWGGIADNATVGVVVPTRFSISASDDQGNSLKALLLMLTVTEIKTEQNSFLPLKEKETNSFLLILIMKLLRMQL